MRFRAVFAGICLLVCGASSASATMLISEDRGGQIGHYLQAFATLRQSGERVVIDGNCLSACTLVLGLVPRDRICVTPRARLGFHAAWMPDDAGRPVTSVVGTQALWNIYPNHVRSWISRHGGLSRKMIFMEGRELAGIVQPCGVSREATGSISRTSTYRSVKPQVIRYDTASASGRRY